MRTRELQRIMKDMQRLTSSQRHEVMAILKAAEAQPEVVALIEHRMTAVAACSHWGCSHIVKNGSMEGSQRYKCRGCSKSFNALAGTPMARLRLRGKWPAYAKALCDGLTLRDAAIRPDTIHGDTQAQSYTVFPLSHLLGIKLMPRIRGIKDLVLHRPGSNK